MYELFKWFVEFGSNWYFHVLTDIYCRKHRSTPLATPETLLSETLLFHGNETFVSWTSTSVRISLASVGEISPNTQGTKTKSVSRAVKLGRMLTCFIRVWRSGLSWYIKSNHKKEIQWGEEERGRNLQQEDSVLTDHQKQQWKECKEISNENLYFWKTMFIVDKNTETD